ncbi:hypothetical protein GCM10010231_34790 [Streptomyces sindenensis]|nr:hypothetical protein GCM10010231_34790 [Streptomyces sindenensis]
MRTSMAMAWAPVGSVEEVAWGARFFPAREGVVRGAYGWGSRGPRLRPGGSRAGCGATDRAGQPAQVDVQPRDEQRARRLVAHVMGNHAGIVSIPCAETRV